MPEYVLKSDGKVMRRPVALSCPEEREVLLTDALWTALRNNQTTTVRNAFQVGPFSPVHLAISAAFTFATVPLPQLSLHTAIETDDKQIVPTFFKDGEERVTLQWDPPKDCRLFLMLHVSPLATVDGTSYVSRQQYLYAVDSDKATFRLPLPNLYDDCRICSGMGAEGFHAPFISDLVVTAVSSIANSQWNSDLLKSLETSQKFFRFSGTAEGFKTIPVRNWQRLCATVGTDLLNFLIV